MSVMTMNAEARREGIKQTLQNAAAPITGSELAQKFQVSRQVIVGDITVLRAGGCDIYATPRGYLLPQSSSHRGKIAVICCRHDRDLLPTELEIIVDNGAKMHDVIVEHPVYGEIRVNLFISTRREIKQFLQKLKQTNAAPLMVMGGGTHYHTIEVPDDETLSVICDELKKAHILVEKA